MPARLLRLLLFGRSLRHGRNMLVLSTRSCEIEDHSCDDRGHEQAIGQVAMTRRETTILAAALAFATVLAFGAGGILSEMGVPLQVAVPAGEFIWAAVVLFWLVGLS
jgi:hypothetical protein